MCHTDRTARWAALEMARQYKQEPPRDLPTAPAFNVAEDIRALLDGDVVQRAVAVEALGAAKSYDPDPTRLAWAAPFLILTMEEDSYPAIRHFAYRALVALVGRVGETEPAVAAAARDIPWFDPEAEPAERREIVARWWRWWTSLDKSGFTRPGDAVPLDDQWMPRRDIVDPLLASQRNQTVSIGE